MEAPAPLIVATTGDGRLPLLEVVQHVATCETATVLIEVGMRPEEAGVFVRRIRLNDSELSGGSFSAVNTALSKFSDLDGVRAVCRRSGVEFRLTGRGERPALKFDGGEARQVTVLVERSGTVRTAP